MAETYELDNPVAILNLKFRQGEPLSWVSTIKNTNWAGTYVAGIVDKDGDGTIIAPMTVVGTFSTPNTSVSIQLTRENSRLLSPGQYLWAARLPSGEVYFRGEVLVQKELVGLG